MKLTSTIHIVLLVVLLVLHGTAFEIFANGRRGLLGPQSTNYHEIDKLKADLMNLASRRARGRRPPRVPPPPLRSRPRSFFKQSPPPPPGCSGPHNKAPPPPPHY
ncbi:hypothetical protein BVRB_4g095550 [Beta vulgaris subsp. vulgaris]|uniref:Uncharacterized protein n=1 Tax=Beta vulgaris subsp. vulgaris TaxID=3555 RepID=A0A0J8B9X8_BETVV|nr:hypothetical protein BVRB_4g095550 [Beta vulgaris subsp. vulgaris]